jgi:hypothetical protein
VTRIGELRTTLALTSNRRNFRRLLVTAKVVPSSPILVILMMEALSSSETSFLQGPHGVTSQKTPFFKVTALKPPNLTGNKMFSKKWFGMDLAGNLPAYIQLTIKTKQEMNRLRGF